MSYNNSHTVSLTKKAPLNEMPFMFLFLSLLPDSKKTPRTRRAAFAIAHAGGITITDPKLAARISNYVEGYDPANP